MEHQASGNFLSNLLVLGKLPKTVRQWAGIARDNYPTIQLSKALTKKCFVRRMERLTRLKSILHGNEFCGIERKKLQLPPPR